MSEEKKNDHPILQNLAVITTPENIQRYILGTKRNGSPRAVYDIIKDYTQPKKHKKGKKHKKHNKGGYNNTYSLYIDTRKKGKKKGKKKHKKHWHI